MPSYLTFQQYELPTAALEVRFVHARGPGGQHVNKASTAVELRVHSYKLDLPSAVLRRLLTQQRNRLNADEQIMIHADQFRSQLKNRKDAEGRLLEMIRAAFVQPKRRIATKPSGAAKRRRLQHKKQRGQTKVNRRKPPAE